MLLMGRCENTEGVNARGLRGMERECSRLHFMVLFPAENCVSAALCVGHGDACRVPSSDHGPGVALWMTWTPPCAGGPCSMKSGGIAGGLSALISCHGGASR